MFPGFDKIVEERIKNAQRKGDFQDLPGSGQPLNLDDDNFVNLDLKICATLESFLFLNNFISIDVSIESCKVEI